MDNCYHFVCTWVLCMYETVLVIAKRNVCTSRWSTTWYHHNSRVCISLKWLKWSCFALMVNLYPISMWSGLRWSCMNQLELMDRKHRRFVFAHNTYVYYVYMCVLRIYVCSYILLVRRESLVGTASQTFGLAV